MAAAVATVRRQWRLPDSVAVLMMYATPPTRAAAIRARLAATGGGRGEGNPLLTNGTGFDGSVPWWRSCWWARWEPLTFAEEGAGGAAGGGGGGVGDGVVAERALLMQYLNEAIMEAAGPIIRTRLAGTLPLGSVAVLYTVYMVVVMLVVVGVAALLANTSTNVPAAAIVVPVVVIINIPTSFLVARMAAARAGAALLRRHTSFAVADALVAARAGGRLADAANGQSVLVWNVMGRGTRNGTLLLAPAGVALTPPPPRQDCGNTGRREGEAVAPPSRTVDVPWRVMDRVRHARRPAQRTWWQGVTDGQREIAMAELAVDEVALAAADAAEDAMPPARRTIWSATPASQYRLLAPLMPPRLAPYMTPAVFEAVVADANGVLADAATSTIRSYGCWRRTSLAPRAASFGGLVFVVALPAFIIMLTSNVPPALPIAIYLTAVAIFIVTMLSFSFATTRLARDIAAAAASRIPALAVTHRLPPAVSLRLVVCGAPAGGSIAGDAALRFELPPPAGDDDAEATEAAVPIDAAVVPIAIVGSDDDDDDGGGRGGSGDGAGRPTFAL